VRVITLNDDEALINYAQPIVNELRANMVRVDSDFSATPFQAKISNAEPGGARLPTSRLARTLAPPATATWAGAVSVRLHHGGPQFAKPKAEVVVGIFGEYQGTASVITLRRQAVCDTAD
jgi:hypothetical protein